MSAACVARVSA